MGKDVKCIGCNQIIWWDKTNEHFMEIWTKHIKCSEGFNSIWWSF